MATSGPLVLLIDDDTDMHDVVRLMLEPMGYRIAACTTASEGLALIGTARPDLVLLDVMLTTPTEGLEVAARLRDDPALRRPVILISSAPLTDRAESDLAGLCARFLEKPLDAQQLRGAVAEVLGESGGGSPC